MKLTIVEVKPGLTEAQYRRVARKLPDPVLECRTVGHLWHILRRPADLPAEVPRFEWGSMLAFRCQRCGKHRFDKIDMRGQVGGRVYTDVPGYALAAERTPSRSTLRRELNHRVKTGATR